MPPATPPLQDHPLRYALTNELHARPSPVVPVPSTAVFLAVKAPHEAVARDRGEDRAHMLDLLDRHGVSHPPPDATHHSVKAGRHGLKWENHTEMTTWMAFSEGLTERPFDPAAFDVFPADWLARVPGMRVTSILFRIEEMPLSGGACDTAAIRPKLDDWFVAESLAAVYVLDRTAIVASDFRIDPAGHLRMAIFVRPQTGQRRVGRIVQRLCEIETYRAMSMLGLARARQVSQQMGALDRRLGDLQAEMAGGASHAEAVLGALIAVSAELERLEMASSFRFGATRAYEAIVHDRIEVLREDRLEGRQTLAEFMRRRWNPAMRTVRAAESRLALLSERAMRAGRLLSTQVEVARSAQNAELLQSMDRRADLQLRLQHTVEGLSVVAISYYAVGLVSNMVTPLAEPVGLSKTSVYALVTPVVVLAVWLALRRIRSKLH
ncbi:DUF3422 domain-containing protein [Rhodobacter sp. NTK016B]|uniref:DUF3422 family protein n=1 Tax=Rhodobacter sp. NTK016B TaxID=2759676 RepID=UPI001A8F06E4|nr:DUF3422 domain-containing protein [Rhodobacter sp. NTK016B]MBN8294634.1 DUF3422 domain-containing protein [Rhodobacter sp. NTK016B]